MGVSELAERWSVFLRAAIEGELQRNSVRKHVADLLELLSLRVTENAARMGEHYIARDRTEMIGIAWAAAGGGIFIAFMALLKILGASIDLALLNQGLMNGAIYGVGFAVIYVCHGIVATKQPAMTASTIATTISKSRGRLQDIEGLAELVISTVRGQNAAIAGNVLVAFPLAVAIALAIRLLIGGTPVAAAKAMTILREIDPLFVPTLFYAAVAGVWLFMAGLVSGYVDNLVAYVRFGDRLALHPWLLVTVGEDRSKRIGAYLERNAGGLAGNLFFGLMLGLTPTIGIITGLPLDIRHIAFSAANFGYSLVALDFHVSIMTIARSGIGLLLIGAVNLVVSFSLALWVALLSRHLDFSCTISLLPEFGRRARKRLARFISTDQEK
jgi:site-specific recombinase